MIGYYFLIVCYVYTYIRMNVGMCAISKYIFIEHLASSRACLRKFLTFCRTKYLLH